MKARLAAAALACAALLAWDLELRSRAAARRVELGRAGPVLPPAERRDVPVAALRLEGAGERWTYARRAGRWSVLGLAAPCDGAAIEGLIGALLGAQGLVVAEDTALAPSYGIAAPETLVVSLLGPRALEDPSGDVLAAFELGRSVPARESSFLRRRGERAIWSVDGDLRAPLVQRVRPGLPPLLDPQLVPRGWAGRREGLQRISVERPGEPPLLLQRVPAAVAPEELASGARPWVWSLEVGGSAREAGEAAASYAAFLQSATWNDLGREDGPPPGSALARLVLGGSQGASLVLEVHPAGASGTPVRVAGDEALLLVDPTTAALLLPRPEQLAASAGDPWSPALGSGGEGGEGG